MALTASKGQNASAIYAQWMTRSDDGYPMGTQTSPNSVAEGVTSGALVTKSMVGHTAPQATIARQIIKASQTVVARVPVGVDDYGTAPVDVAEYSETLMALIKNTSVDVTTVDGWAMTAPNMAQSDFRSLIVAISGTFTNTSNGAAEWMTYLYHNVKATESQTANMSQISGDQVNPNPSQITLDPSASTNLLGFNFSSTAMDVSNDTDVYTKIRTRYPLHFVTYIADDTSGTFTLPYTPVYTDVDGDVNNLILKNGVISAVTSINAGTRAVAYTGATAGDIFVVAYQVLSSNLVAAA